MNKINAMITKKIIEKLNSGKIPWIKPWFTEPSFNRKTMRAYRGVNKMLLEKPGEYATYKQWEELGGKVKKGAKSEFVVFYTDYKKVTKDEETEEETENTYKCLRYYCVFHIDDVEGIDPLPKEEIPQFEEIEDAESLLTSYWDGEGIEVETGKKACYYPGRDSICLPPKESFKTNRDYYSTAFHESVHSTGSEKRLKRDLKNGFGSKKYSFEELIAEIGSAMLCDKTGVGNDATLNNSAGYIQGWLHYLEDNKDAVVKAASKATKACEYILQYAVESEKSENNNDETTTEPIEVIEPETEPITAEPVVDETPFDLTNPIITIKYMNGNEVTSVPADLRKLMHSSNISCMDPVSIDKIKPFYQLISQLVNREQVEDNIRLYVKFQVAQIEFLSKPEQNPALKQLYSQKVTEWNNLINSFDAKVKPVAKPEIKETPKKTKSTSKSTTKSTSKTSKPTSNKPKKGTFYTMIGVGGKATLEEKNGTIFEKGGYTFNAYKRSNETIILLDGTGLSVKSYVGAISKAPDYIDDQVLELLNGKEEMLKGAREKFNTLLEQVA